MCDIDRLLLGDWRPSGRCPKRRAIRHQGLEFKDTATDRNPAAQVNRPLAGYIDVSLAAQLGLHVLRWVIGASFLAMAVWMLITDKVDSNAAEGKQRFGVFGATVLAFFLAEMGDKTQIATVALAARYHDLVPVVAGTTLGMMLADVPAVFLGDTIGKKVSMPLVHGLAALIFGILGVLALLNVGSVF